LPDCGNSACGIIRSAVGIISWGNRSKARFPAKPKEAVQKLGFLNNAIIEPPEKANFYRRTGMKIVDFLNKQDWDGAIAECTAIIDKYAECTDAIDKAAECTDAIDKAKGNTAGTNTPTQPLYEIFMNRGYARCFVPSQNDNYQEAVDDLSMAITLVPNGERAYTIKESNE
jgi:hypothetical protein